MLGFRNLVFKGTFSNRAPFPCCLLCALSNVRFYCRYRPGLLIYFNEKGEYPHTMTSVLKQVGKRLLTWLFQHLKLYKLKVDKLECFFFTNLLEMMAKLYF